MAMTRRRSTGSMMPRPANVRPDAVFASILALLTSLKAAPSRTPGVSSEAFSQWLATGSAAGHNTSREVYAEALGTAQGETLRTLAADPAARAYVEQLADALDTVLDAAKVAPASSLVADVGAGIADAAGFAADVLF